MIGGQRSRSDAGILGRGFGGCQAVGSPPDGVSVGMREQVVPHPSPRQVVMPAALTEGNSRKIVFSELAERIAD